MVFSAVLDWCRHSFWAQVRFDISLFLFVIPITPPQRFSQTHLHAL